MQKEQEQFYNFILGETKPEHQEAVKALLVDAFANLDTDNFTKADLKVLATKLTPLLKEESVTLVTNVFTEFGKNLQK
ncbi:hypothetical protein P7G51_05300 [Enterococcus asini]|uniref:hypothetical protein n=1 Tax=Enterococcus asini TaxID=57732 RepID=UPI00288DE57C|nr:hypothetical protein [Enterococcus asini]MDT2756789.1 hypothetical protein [Enterococcus asini]